MLEYTLLTISRSDDDEGDDSHQVVREKTGESEKKSE